MRLPARTFRTWLGTATSAVTQRQAIDKAQFIATAPIYYAIAIVHFFGEKQVQDARSTEIERRYNETDHPDDTSWLPFQPFFEKAVAFLETGSLIEGWMILLPRKC